MVELKSALGAKKLELQLLPGFATENAFLPSAVSQLYGSGKTLKPEKKKTEILTLNVRHSTRSAGKIRASAETLKRQNLELDNDVCDKETLGTMKTALVDALTLKQAIAKPELAVSCVKGLFCCWSTRNVSMRAS